MGIYNCKLIYVIQTKRKCGAMNHSLQVNLVDDLELVKPRRQAVQARAKPKESPGVKTEAKSGAIIGYEGGINHLLGSGSDSNPQDNMDPLKTGRPISINTQTSKVEIYLVTWQNSTAILSVMYHSRGNIRPNFSS